MYQVPHYVIRFIPHLFRYSRVNVRACVADRMMNGK